MSTQFIMIDGHEFRLDIKQAAEERLDHMIGRFCSVFLIQFIVRYPAGYPAPHSNELCSELLRRFKEYYTYHGITTHYLAVREQNTSDNPHYHVAFLFDGSKIDNGWFQWHRAAEMWARMIPNATQACVHQCPTFTGRDGLMIERPRQASTGLQLHHEQVAFEAAYDEARTWLLYLAKTFTKGSAPHKVKEWFCSRL